MKLSIIIVNYNTQKYLKPLLQSIKASADSLNKEVIVIDNASTDDSVAMLRRDFAWVKLIINRHNMGFAAGNNVGIRAAKGEYVLLLNSDTEILKNTLSLMIKFMDQNPEVGVSTCKVELASGDLDPACHRGFPTPWASLTYFLGLEKIFPTSRVFAQYHQGWKNLNTIHEIDSPVGAFYLVRKQAIAKAGLLDEQFFMYAEDLDWSLRIKNQKFKIMYVPTAKIIHHKKKSGRESADQALRMTTKNHFFTTMKLFYDKHYRHQYPFMVRWLTLMGIWIISKFKY